MDYLCNDRPPWCHFQHAVRYAPYNHKEQKHINSWSIHIHKSTFTLFLPYKTGCQLFINRGRNDCIYIIPIIQKHGHKVLSIGGTSDHIHVLFGFRPTQALSALMQEVKRDSSAWINQEKLVRGRFSWQEGYGAFSYSKSHISRVARYIETQEEHHRKKSFVEEYKKMLKDFNVEYDERYIFKAIEN